MYFIFMIDMGVHENKVYVSSRQCALYKIEAHEKFSDDK